MSAPIEEPAEATPTDTASIPAEVIARLKQKYGELRLYESEEFRVICRAPSRPEYKRFMQMVYSQGQKSLATEALLVGSVVYPDTEGLMAMLERRPGLAELWGDKLMTWAQAGAQVTEKKL